jgi:hypothetical protein
LESLDVVNVLARSRSGTGKIRRRRNARQQPPGAEPAQKAVLACPDAAGSPTPPSRRRREAGPPPDLALYSCRCGFVFEASVSTSVGCPHCGNTQAW